MRSDGIAVRRLGQVARAKAAPCARSHAASFAHSWARSALVALRCVAILAALSTLVACKGASDDGGEPANARSPATTAPAGEADAGAPPPRDPTTAAALAVVERVNQERSARSAPGQWTLVRATPLTRGGDALVEVVLDNGLTVFVVEDRSVPVISYQTWFRAGSRDDPPGLNGLAHMLEHLMFRATASLPDGEFDRQMERWGINPSAYTWLDYTYYFQKIPSDRLEPVAAIEASRMSELEIRSELVDAERDVVRSERRYRVDNDPVGALTEMVYGTAFPTHPYAHQSVGTAKGLRAIGVEECEMFYRRHYHPANAAVVLVGDVGLARALEVIADAYAPIPARPLVRVPFDDPVWADERPQRALRMPIEAELLLLTFPAPAGKTRESVVLQVLNRALFADPFGIFHRELKTERELLTHVDGWVGEFAMPALYEISVSMRPGVSHKDVRIMLLEGLANLAEVQLPETLLERARANLELEFLERIQDTYGRAEGIGHEWATGADPHTFFDLVEEARAVTAKDIQALAAELFRRETLTEALGLRTADIGEDGEPTEEAGEDEAGTAGDGSAERGGRSRVGSGGRAGRWDRISRWIPPGEWSGFGVPERGTEPVGGRR